MTRSSPPAPPDRRSLRLSVLDGALHAVMVGVTESYLGALAVQLGHRDTALALLVTLPLLAGAVAQLAAAPLTRWLGSRRRLVVFFAFGQAVTHAAFLFIAATADTRLWPLLLAKVLFWTLGLGLVPAWNTWMAALTDPVDRERYFAWRSAIVHVVLLGAFVGGSFALSAGRQSGRVLDAFGLLYAIGLTARLGSALALYRKSDPTPVAPTEGSFHGRMRKAVKEGHLRVPFYIGALMFGGQISIPFFTPYMLRTLGFDFREFAAVLAVSILAKAMSFPVWRRVGTRHGLRGVLLASGIAIALIPLLWAGADSFEALLAVNAVSGTAWAGYEYSTLQLLIQDAPKTVTVEYFSLATSLSGFMQVAGSLVGSTLLERFGFTYPDVFVASSIGRGVALVVLLPGIWSLVRFGRLKRFFLRLVSVRPSGGVDRAPVVPPDDDDEPEPGVG